MPSATGGRTCAGERPPAPSATLFLRSQAVTVAFAGRRTARVPDVVRPHPAPAGTPGATCCGVTHDRAREVMRRHGSSGHGGDERQRGVARGLTPAPDPGGE